MFRRRARNFSRFRSRFKGRRRSPYPHQGGRYQRCQFTETSNLVGADGASYVVWFDILSIVNHLADNTTPEGYVFNQIARYIEVKAIQWDATLNYFQPPAAGGGGNTVAIIDWLYAAWIVERLDSAGLPSSSGFYDPFTTESPVANYPPSPVTAQMNVQSPLRILREKYWHAQGGNLNSVAQTWDSSGYHGRWSSRYRRPVRLDDTTGLYWVVGRNSLQGGGSITNITCSGSLWYRVVFGR